MKKISFGSKLAYSIGDFASQFSFSFASTYLTVFYTDIVGIAPAIISVLLLVCRIWDGVNDPMFGAIAERTRTKMGRFRPFILIGSPILSLVTVLCFTIPFSGTATVVWAFITYIALDMAYTAVNVSYGALAGVMTYDSKERVELNSWRMIGSYAGNIVLSAIGMPLLMRFSEAGATAPTQSGYFTTALIFSLSTIPLFLIVFKGTKEVIQPADGSDGKRIKISIGKTLKSIFTNKPLILVFVALFCAFIGMGTGTSIYYLMYFMGDVSLVAPYYTLQSVAGIVAMLVMGPLTAKIGKKATVLISLAGCAIARAGLWFVPQGNTTMMYVMVTITGLLFFAPAILMAMIPECVDHGEIKFGVRSDGTAYAAISMATKLAMAVGPSIGMVILSVTGYTPNVEQTASSLAGINFATNMLPAILGIVGFIAFLFYPISTKRANEMAEELLARRGEVEPSLAAEIADNDVTTTETHPR